jgi:hypothetical protein
MNDVIFILLMGIGATALMDVWGVIRKPLLGVPSPDYGMVGRWFLHMPRGRFHHQTIAASAAIKGENIVGWTAHYLIGVVFAALLIVMFGASWMQQPTIIPALLVGVFTIVAPFCLMQPGMGAGFAASRTPKPNSARLQSLITHTVFGFGLYLSGLMAHFLLMN